MKKRLWLIIFLFFISGCQGHLKNVKTFGTSENKSVVFGKVSFFEPSGAQCYVRFNNVETRKFHEISVKDGLLYYKSKKKGKWDGFVEDIFFKELAPGNYHIKQINIIGGDMYVNTFNPKIDFTVPANTIVYIGTLNYGFEKEHDYLFVKTGKRYLWISDDYDEAVAELRHKYPYLDGDITVELMKLPQTE